MRRLPRHNEHGWTPYVWLIYLAPYVAFPFVIETPAVVGTRWLSWLLWAAGLVVFLSLYFRAYWVDGAARVPLIIGLGALGAVLSWINPGALFFFTYAAGFVAGAVPARSAGLWLGGLTAAGALAGWLTPWHPLFVAGVAVMTPVIGFVNLHYAETRRRDASLALAHEEIARLARIAERERIAADLHDLLGHTLSVIVLKSELAAKLVSRDPSRAAAEIADVERVSRDALAEVRRAVYGFRTATLADEIARARAVLSSTGIVLEGGAVPAGVLDGLPSSTEHAAAMILRESITNIVRHARATRCRIAVERSDALFVLRIEDDGAGGMVKEGTGIQSMRARAEEVGGRLEIEASRGDDPGAPRRAGRGLTVTFVAPGSPPA